MEARDDLMAVSPDDPERRIGFIPLERIHNVRPQVRRDWRHDDGQRKLDALVDSIKQLGVLQASEVSPREDGDYDVLDGHRRYVAAKRAGLVAIPCTVRAASEEERIVIGLVENVQRHNLSFEDEVGAYVELIEKHGYTVADVARKVSLSEEVIHRKLRTFRDSFLRDAVAKGLIGPKVAAHLAELREDYAAPLVERLRGGSRVTLADVYAARRRQADGGVYERQADARIEREDTALSLHEQGKTGSEIGAALGISDTNAVKLVHRAKARSSGDLSFLGDGRRRRVERAAQLRAQGKPIAEIARAFGVCKQRIDEDLRLHRLAASREEPPNATFTPAATGTPINLDPVIAKGIASEAPPAKPHPRPDPKNLLPWERPRPDGPPARLAYTVDPSGVVLDVKDEPKTPPTPPATVAPPPPPPHIEPTVQRLRDIIAPLDDATYNIILAVVRVGDEQAWACSRLWTKLAQARVLAKGR